MAQIGKAATRDARSVRPGAAQMTQFLESLAESSNVAASARAAGVTGNAMYRERRRNAGFAARWHAALCEGFARLEAELLSEALVAPSGNVKDATLKSRAQKYRLGLALLAAHRAAVRGAKLPGGGGTATQGSAKERLRNRSGGMAQFAETERSAIAPLPQAGGVGGAVQAFDAVDFPLAIGREAMVATEFSTQIVSSPSGHEQRASEWAEARMRYDAGPGIRSEADVRTLADFFRARRGAARGFRFRDPFDASSAADGGLPTAGDQMLGIGDGVRRQFALVKRYGAVDLPLGEGREAWQIALSPPVPGIAPWERATPDLQIAADVLAALPPGTTIAIRQVGDFALSPPLSLSLT